MLWWANVGPGFATRRIGSDLGMTLTHSSILQLDTENVDLEQGNSDVQQRGRLSRSFCTLAESFPVVQVGQNHDRPHQRHVSRLRIR